MAHRVFLFVALLSVALAAPEPSRLSYNDELGLEERRHNQEPEHSLVPWVHPEEGLKQHGHSSLSPEEKKIVQFTEGPVYYQPYKVLDYRFLKKGRDYVRGLGGLVIILPKDSKEPDQKSFDALLEHIKQSYESRPDNYQNREYYEQRLNKELLRHREESQEPKMRPEYKHQEKIQVHREKPKVYRGEHPYSSAAERLRQIEYKKPERVVPYVQQHEMKKHEGIREGLQREHRVEEDMYEITKSVYELPQQYQERSHGEEPQMQYYRMPRESAPEKNLEQRSE